MSEMHDNLSLRIVAGDYERVARESEQRAQLLRFCATALAATREFGSSTDIGVPLVTIIANRVGLKNSDRYGAKLEVEQLLDKGRALIDEMAASNERVATGAAETQGRVLASLDNPTTLQAS